MKLFSNLKQKTIRTRIIRVLIGMGFTMVILFAVAVQYRGRWVPMLPQRIQDFYYQKITDPAMIRQCRYLPSAVLSDPEQMYIDLKFKNYQKLAFMRQEALDGKGTDFEYVPAKMRVGDAQCDIRVRLKGDRKVHFSDDAEWSFRVQTKGGATVLGMKYFSLHKPQMKNYIHEWIYHKALSYEDILSLRYLFVNLFVNGMDLGVYALEEHFDKRLLEHQQRREGPIIRFNEDYCSVNEGQWYLNISPIHTFHITKKQTEMSRNQLRSAINLLEGFRRNELKVSDVFKTEKLAMYFALSDLLGTLHGTVSKSIRFYYDPIAARLEPIGFDGHRGASDMVIAAEAATDQRASWLYSLYGDWYGLLFNNEIHFDKDFFVQYVRALQKVSSESYLPDLLNELQMGIEENLAILHRDFPLKKDHIFSFGPDLFLFDAESYYEHQTYIRAVLASDPRIHAYLQTNNQAGVVLRVGNTFRLPVEIVDVKWGSSSLMAKQQSNILLGKPASTQVDDVPQYYDFAYAFTNNADDMSQAETVDLIVEYSIVGNDRIFQTEVQPYAFEYSWAAVDASIQCNVTYTNFSFIKVDEMHNRITVCSGTHHLHQSIVFPPGYTIVVEPGVILDLHDSAFIMSRSPIKIIGRPDNPVIIESSDGTGGGFAVILNETEKGLSCYEHVVFRNLDAPHNGGWALTGAVTLYQAKSDLSYVVFDTNHSEDYLNIVRSSFHLSNVSFCNTFSDAMDMDFSSGEIDQVVFNDCGNDAIDISGGDISINNALIRGTGDKGISIGEESTVLADGIRIGEAVIGVSCKDNSSLKISNCVIYNSKIGFAAYQKKAEYGPARIEATSAKLSEVEMPFMIEIKSRMVLDGKEIEDQYERVNQTLYGEE